MFAKTPKKVLSTLEPREAIKELSKRGQRKPFDHLKMGNQLAWCFYALYSEAMNGTLEQYAANSSGDLYLSTLHFMRLISSQTGESILSELDVLLGGAMPRNRQDRVEAVQIAREANELEFEGRIRGLTTRLEEQWPNICEEAAVWLSAHLEELE